MSTPPPCTVSTPPPWSVPSGLDVLVTHGPPLGILDRTYDGQHVGCEDLKRTVEDKRPKLHVFGHIHEGYGVERAAATTFVNASLCDLSYRAVHAPVVMELAPGEPLAATSQRRPV